MYRQYSKQDYSVHSLYASRAFTFNNYCSTPLRAARTYQTCFLLVAMQHPLKHLSLHSSANSKLWKTFWMEVQSERCIKMKVLDLTLDSSLQQMTLMLEDCLPAWVIYTLSLLTVQMSQVKKILYSTGESVTCFLQYPKLFCHHPITHYSC